MTKYQRVLTVENVRQILTTTTYTSGPFRTINTAMRDGKSVLRDLRQGVWSINGLISRPGYLVLTNDSDGRRATIEAIEIDQH